MAERNFHIVQIADLNDRRHCPKPLSCTQKPCFHQALAKISQDLIFYDYKAFDGKISHLEWRLMDNVSHEIGKSREFLSKISILLKQVGRIINTQSKKNGMFPHSNEFYTVLMRSVVQECKVLLSSPTERLIKVHIQKRLVNSLSSLLSDTNRRLTRNIKCCRSAALLNVLFIFTLVPKDVKDQSDFFENMSVIIVKELNMTGDFVKLIGERQCFFVQKMLQQPYLRVFYRFFQKCNKYMSLSNDSPIPAQTLSTKESDGDSDYEDDSPIFNVPHKINRIMLKPRTKKCFTYFLDALATPATETKAKQHKFLVRSSVSGSQITTEIPKPMLLLRGAKPGTVSCLKKTLPALKTSTEESIAYICEEVAPFSPVQNTKCSATLTMCDTLLGPARTIHMGVLCSSYSMLNYELQEPCAALCLDQPPSPTFANNTHQEEETYGSLCIEKTETHTPTSYNVKPFGNLVNLPDLEKAQTALCIVHPQELHIARAITTRLSLGLRYTNLKSLPELFNQVIEHFRWQFKTFAALRSTHSNPTPMFGAAKRIKCHIPHTYIKGPLFVQPRTFRAPCRVLQLLTVDTTNMLRTPSSSVVEVFDSAVRIFHTKPTKLDVASCRTECTFLPICYLKENTETCTLLPEFVTPLQVTAASRTQPCELQQVDVKVAQVFPKLTVKIPLARLPKELCERLLSKRATTFLDMPDLGDVSLQHNDGQDFNELEDDRPKLDGVLNRIINMLDDPKPNENLDMLATAASKCSRVNAPVKKKRRNSGFRRRHNKKRSTEPKPTTPIVPTTPPPPPPPTNEELKSKTIPFKKRKSYRESDEVEVEPVEKPKEKRTKKTSSDVPRRVTRSLTANLEKKKPVQAWDLREHNSTAFRDADADELVFSVTREYEAFKNRAIVVEALTNGRNTIEPVVTNGMVESEAPVENRKRKADEAETSTKKCKDNVVQVVGAGNSVDAQEITAPSSSTSEIPQASTSFAQDTITFDQPCTSTEQNTIFTVEPPCSSSTIAIPEDKSLSNIEQNSVVVEVQQTSNIQVTSLVNEFTQYYNRFDEAQKEVQVTSIYKQLESEACLFENRSSANLQVYLDQSVCQKLQYDRLTNYQGIRLTPQMTNNNVAELETIKLCRIDENVPRIETNNKVDEVEEPSPPFELVSRGDFTNSDFSTCDNIFNEFLEQDSEIAQIVEDPSIMENLCCDSPTTADDPVVSETVTVTATILTVTAPPRRPINNFHDLIRNIENEHARKLAEKPKALYEYLVNNDPCMNSVYKDDSLQPYTAASDSSKLSPAAFSEIGSEIDGDILNYLTDVDKPVVLPPDIGHRRTLRKTSPKKCTKMKTYENQTKWAEGIPQRTLEPPEQLLEQPKNDRRFYIESMLNTRGTTMYGGGPSGIKKQTLSINSKKKNIIRHRLTAGRKNPRSQNPKFLDNSHPKNVAAPDCFQKSQVCFQSSEETFFPKKTVTDVVPFESKTAVEIPNDQSSLVKKASTEDVDVLILTPFKLKRNIRVFELRCNYAASPKAAAQFRVFLLEFFDAASAENYTLIAHLMGDHNGVTYFRWLYNSLVTLDRVLSKTGFWYQLRQMLVSTGKDLLIFRAVVENVCDQEFFETLCTTQSGLQKVQETHAAVKRHRASRNTDSSGPSNIDQFYRLPDFFKELLNQAVVLKDPGLSLQIAATPKPKMTENIDGAFSRHPLGSFISMMSFFQSLRQKFFKNQPMKCEIRPSNVCVVNPTVRSINGSAPRTLQRLDNMRLLNLLLWPQVASAPEVLASYCNRWIICRGKYLSGDFESNWSRQQMFMAYIRYVSRTGVYVAYEVLPLDSWGEMDESFDDMYVSSVQLSPNEAAHLIGFYRNAYASNQIETLTLFDLFYDGCSTSNEEKVENSTLQVAGVNRACICNAASNVNGNDDDRAWLARIESQVPGALDGRNVFGPR